MNNYWVLFLSIYAIGCAINFGEIVYDNKDSPETRWWVIAFQILSALYLSLFWVLYKPLEFLKHHNAP